MAQTLGVGNQLGNQQLGEPHFAPCQSTVKAFVQPGKCPSANHAAFSDTVL